MADSTAVAIVGVSAGALVAVVSPIINGRQITAGQKRKFEHDEWLADRRELRVLLDDTAHRLLGDGRSAREALRSLSRAEDACESYVICEAVETPNRFIFVRGMGGPRRPLCPLPNVAFLRLLHSTRRGDR